MIPSIGFCPNIITTTVWTRAEQHFYKCSEINPFLWSVDISHGPSWSFVWYPRPNIWWDESLPGDIKYYLKCSSLSSRGSHSSLFPSPEKYPSDAKPTYFQFDHNPEQYWSGGGGGWMTIKFEVLSRLWENIEKCEMWVVCWSKFGNIQ